MFLLGGKRQIGQGAGGGDERDERSHKNGIVDGFCAGDDNFVGAQSLYFLGDHSRYF